MCSSEVLTGEAVARVERAWGTKPFNVYAATEPAGMASHCKNHRLHLFEDLVISEVVDEKNHPVPPGTTGAKVLVTVLFSRTQPLIRYEMSDRVARNTETCDCGLPFALLSNIEGRAEDILQLPSAAGGSISVHPNVFHRVMESLPVREWQIIQEADRLRVLIVEPRTDVVLDEVRRNVETSLREAGATVPVCVELATAVTRTPLGKAPLVRARH
jgi:phenylacetate-coenzyme A ligase PaaK-like adenylate-forming protein